MLSRKQMKIFVACLFTLIASLWGWSAYQTAGQIDTLRSLRAEEVTRLTLITGADQFTVEELVIEDRGEIDAFVTGCRDLESLPLPDRSKRGMTFMLRVSPQEIDIKFSVQERYPGVLVGNLGKKGDGTWQSYGHFQSKNLLSWALGRFAGDESEEEPEPPADG